MIIAIDGPTAAGKGTLARLLAKTLGYAYLDSGALYRAVALALRLQNQAPDDPVAAITAARQLDPALLDDPRLREEAIGNDASRIAAIPEVRVALLDYQRQFASHPPGGALGAVLDGRDIGTVVCPTAHVKLFVTASAAVRAQRRYRELIGRGQTIAYDQVLVDLEIRDRRDAERAVAPLKPAPDAHLLDTTDLAIDAALDRAMAFIRTKI